MFDDLGNPLQKGGGKKLSQTKTNTPKENTNTPQNKERKILLWVIAFLGMFVVSAGIYWFTQKRGTNLKVDDLSYTFITTLNMGKDTEKVDIELALQELAGKADIISFQYKIGIALSNEILIGNGKAHLEQKTIVFDKPSNPNPSKQATQIAQLLCNKKATIKKIFQNINFETPEWVLHSR
jgi:hypothetical protein